MQFLDDSCKFVLLIVDVFFFFFFTQVRNSSHTLQQLVVDQRLFRPTAHVRRQSLPVLPLKLKKILLP